MSDKDKNEENIDAIGVTDFNKTPVSNSITPTDQPGKQDSYQEGNTLFLKRDVTVFGAGLPPSLSLPVSVKTIPGMRKIFRRGGTESYERSSGSSSSSDDAVISSEDMSGTYAKRKNVDGKNNNSYSSSS